MSGEFRAEVRKVVDATDEEIYDAWTQPELLAEFITYGGKMIKADVRVGGEYAIDMGCGGGKTAVHHGVYRVLDRPRVIEFTWISDWTAGESIVRIEITPRGDETLVVLTHTGLPDQANADDHGGGWGEFIELSAACAHRHRKPA
jgi:uncharacterized protein YndB with AHSA1/START domain